MTKQRTLLILLFIALIATLMVFAALKRFAPPPIIGRTLPAQTLSTLYGEDIAFSTLPQEPFLLVTFASWCTTCRAEQPFLMTLANKGIPLYGLAWRDTSDKAKFFLEDLGNPFKRVLFDPKGKTTHALGLKGTPEIFVINNHMILYKHIGVLTEDVFNTHIKPLLSTK